MTLPPRPRVAALAELVGCAASLAVTVALLLLMLALWGWL